MGIERRNAVEFTSGPGDKFFRRLLFAGHKEEQNNFPSEKVKESVEFMGELYEMLHPDNFPGESGHLLLELVAGGGMYRLFGREGGQNIGFVDKNMNDLRKRLPDQVGESFGCVWELIKKWADKDEENPSPEEREKTRNRYLQEAREQVLKLWGKLEGGEITTVG